MRWPLTTTTAERTLVSKSSLHNERVMVMDREEENPKEIRRGGRIRERVAFVVNE